MDAETEYIGELKGLYTNLTATKTSDLQWPPPCTHKVFNLAMIKEEPIKRNNVSDSFVRMTITGKLDDILHVKTPIELENIFNGVRPNKRKVVLMEGAPGCGKSTLANFISQQWGEDKIFAELKFKAVILVRLRDPVVQKAEFIIDLFPSGDDITVAQKAEESMRTSKYQDVLFILDGWDELPKKLREDSIFCKLIQDDQAERHGLDNSAVIVTSRPVASGDLHKIVFTRVEILGFTPNELHNYFHECLGGNSEAVRTLMERIEENPEIAGTCYLPLNASILVHLFKHCHGSNLPASQYGIFSLLVCTCISRHLNERPLHRSPSLETVGQFVDTEIVKEPQERTQISLETLDQVVDTVKEPFQFLCNLAYDGVMNDRITFSSLPDSTNTLSILHGVESFIKHADKVKSYNFIHLSIQELLAAFYMVKWLPQEKQVETFNELFDNPRFNAVFQFYSAMTKLQTPGINNILIKVAERCYDDNDDEAKILLISLFHCLNAAQDSSLCEKIMKYLQYDLDLGHTTLNPTDCLCIGYFLSCACSLSTTTDTSEFRVELENCDMGDKGCKYLVRGLQRCLTTSDHTATTLYMDLQWSNVQEEGSIELSKLLQLNCINTLKLNENENLCDQGTFHIAEKLKTNKSLVELQLYTCGVTAKGIGYIAEALMTNNSLKFLNLGGNGFYDEGIKCLASALRINQSLETLDISSCGMTDLGLNYIADSLARNESLIKLEMYNYRNQKHLNELDVNGDAIKNLTGTVGRTSALQSLVLPKEFESILQGIQRRINEEREFYNLAQLKVDAEGQTLIEIMKESDDEEMEVEDQPNETDQNETSIKWKSKSPDIIEESNRIQKSKAFSEAEQEAKVPFLHHEILECDCGGLQYTNPDHDVSITIPEGAVSEGDIVHFELGVTMFGPTMFGLFKFVGGARPISPIAWICLLEENYKLKKPYRVILPHMLTQLSSERLQYHQVKVAKAEHKFFNDDEESKSYEFHPCDIEPIFGFIGHKSYAALESVHFCFYCLEANQTLELDRNIGYCLVRVIQESIPNKVYFLAMYFLGTCLKSLKEQFPPEEGYKIDDRKEFKFKDSPEPYIRINISPKYHEVIAMEPMNSQIKASDIDFWRSKYDIHTMRLKHEERMYPPRVKMTIPVHPGFNKLPITFDGYLNVCQSLDVELVIPLAEDMVHKSPWPWHCSHYGMSWYGHPCYWNTMDKKRDKRKGSGRRRAMSALEGSVSRKVRKKLSECKSASVGDEPMVEDVYVTKETFYKQMQLISERIVQDDHKGWLLASSSSSAASIIPGPTTDLAQPNLGNLTVIVWANSEGKHEYFRLQESICDKWILIGDLLHIPYLLLDAWKKTLGNPLNCIREVLTYWLDNGPRTYQVSWEGVYELLDDAELTDFVAPLKEAIENAQPVCTTQVIQQMSQSTKSASQSTSSFSSQSITIPEIDLVSSDDEPFSNSSGSASSHSTMEKDSVTPSSIGKPIVRPPVAPFVGVESSNLAQESGPQVNCPITSSATPHQNLDTTPSLALLSVLKTCEGKKIRIIKRAATFWRQLGLLMDFDNTGTQLEIIEKQHPMDPEACCLAVFQHWLKGNGAKPCSWYKLIELIDDCGEEVLAKEIQSALSKSAV